ncbi:polysaccharide deacetylase family protein [Vulcanisaeta moutnovskia 768-28]|uniref:Polysaccharide deacetylase family protein n=2 Tax=Vulcanisaeta TaxID=164450 RepID=F0QY56_VULM7|nr:polysaccharide deacetylase family protein [Vulcanisaeta moutnovskia 768-28]
MYHEIDRNIYYDIGVSKQYFEQQIKYLLRMKFRIMPLCEALELIKEGKGLSNRIAVLSFDDGYRGVYEVALPIMKKYDVKGTVYISFGLVENKIPNWATAIAYVMTKLRLPTEIDTPQGTFRVNSDYERQRVTQIMINSIPRMKQDELSELVRALFDHIHDDLHRLYEETMLTPDQIKEFVEEGFEIGGHGYYHLGLPYLDDNDLAQEIELSKNFVNKYNRNCTMNTFAYPFGLYDTRVINEVKHRGFSAAVTMKTYLNKISRMNYFELGRFPPYRFFIPHLSTFKYQVIVG